jgi:hypothetical protein
MRQPVTACFRVDKDDDAAPLGLTRDVFLQRLKLIRSLSHLDQLGDGPSGHWVGLESVCMTV